MNRVFKKTDLIDQKSTWWHLRTLSKTNVYNAYVGESAYSYYEFTYISLGVVPAFEI